MGALKTAAASFAFLGLSITGAQAGGLFGLFDDPVSTKDGPVPSVWVVTIGGYGVAEPSFPGSKDYQFTGRPIFDIYRAGDREWLSLPNDAASVTVWESGNFRAGIAADWISGRYQSDGREVEGLRNVDSTLELGGFMEYYPAPWLRTRVELLQGVTGAEGFVANLMADFIYSPDPQWLFTFGPRLKFVDDSYNDAFFSINHAESIRSGTYGLTALDPYCAKGGLYSAGVDATVKYNVTERFSVRAFAEWNHLAGDAADSPLVQYRGSEDQFQFGLGAAYKFDISF